MPANQGDDEKVDRMSENSFPASDPPSTSPPPGTRRAEGGDAANPDAAGEPIPKGHPTSDRYHGEVAAGRQRGVDPPEKDQGPAAPGHTPGEKHPSGA